MLAAIRLYSPHAGVLRQGVETRRHREGALNPGGISFGYRIVGPLKPSIHIAAYGRTRRDNGAQLKM
jgi:hypothetical protein